MCRRDLSGDRGSVGILDAGRADSVNVANATTAGKENIMTYTVLDPTNEPIRTTFKPAPRPETLKGLTLGLIDNGKKNSDYLVKKIGHRLRALYGLSGDIHVRKPSPSHAIPEDMAEELAGKVDLVVAGIGD